MNARLVVAALLLPALAASAADVPDLIPTRDVDISYKLESPDRGKQKFRVRWLSDEKLERIDGADQAITLIDHARNQLEVLNPSLKTFVMVDAPEKGMYFPSIGPSAEPGQQVQVANYACREWHWEVEGKMSVLCVTDDGVPLRFFDGTDLHITATHVTYGKLKPKLFRIPRGFEETPTF